MMTTKRIGPGQFEVYWRGEKTDLDIFNGSLGLSGRDTRNVYGIGRPGKKPVWVGTLQSAKKWAAYWLKKREEEGA